MSRRVLILLVVLTGSDCVAAPETCPAAPVSGRARLPVREVTVFKDGHALLLRSGELPTNTAGQVVLDELPAPVMGTFWPYCADPRARLRAVVAGPRPITVERTALTRRELLLGTVGAEVHIEETGGARIFGTIVTWPVRDPAELELTSPPGDSPFLPHYGDVLVVATPDGARVVPLDQIQRVTFKGDYRPTHAADELRNVLTLRLDWGDEPPPAQAAVGMMYVQKGIRWIPNYRVTLGDGAVHVELQATLLNELTDLEDVTANLVIGVPSFALAGTPDPIGLQTALAQLSPYFQSDARTPGALSNALMTQTARMTECRAAATPQPEAPVAPEPELSDAERSEDLFVFTVQHVTLRKGERMVLPVVEFELPYRDVFTLDLPFVPPAELRAQLNVQVPPELAHAWGAPKVYHALRLTNTSACPLTTAPALILSGTQVLAQGMLTYAAPGGTVDLRVTAAVDVRVAKTDREERRVPNVVEWQGSKYDRAELAGTIALTNLRGVPVTVEVTRHVLGNVDQADHGGRIEGVNALEDWSYLPSGAPEAGRAWHWWHGYGWPHWWHHFNGVGRIRWEVTLEPGVPLELNYSWHYFWR